MKYGKRIEMRKTTLALWLMMQPWAWRLTFADDVMLDGPDVIHYDYPENFKEDARLLRQGRLTADGMCEFVSKLHAKPGETVAEHEIAYDPFRCRSLVVQSHRGTGKK